MPTNREVFFALLNENNKYFTRYIVKSLLNYANGFYNDIDLYKAFDVECPKYEEISVMAERIRNGEPFQYVLGYANFIDRYFVVNKNVLIPRHETEELVISTKRYIEKMFPNMNFTLADIGTGSGCIPISFKRYYPSSKVYAVDISKDALEVAKQNAELHNAEIQFVEGDMLNPLINKDIRLDVLISNPPYIEDESTIDEQVFKYEPHIALLAKPSTKFYEEIFKNADKIMNPNCVMAFEIGEDMEESLSVLVEQYFPTAAYKIAKDMYNKIRYLFIIRREDMNYA